MNIVIAVKEALESLNANKMRAGLTILGIVIGVAAVIAMLAIGTGAQNTILGSINSVGTNLLFVFQGNTQQDVRNARQITVSDVNAMEDIYQAPHVQMVSPVVYGYVNATYGGESSRPELFGVASNFEATANYGMTEGSFITDENVNGRASVALLGPDVADKLFGRRTNVVGETIRLEGQPFRVIGLLESKGGGSVGSQDNVIFVPITTARVRLLERDRDTVDIVYIQAVDAKSVSIASDEVSQILRSRHHTEIGMDDFTIYSQEDILSVAGTITSVLTVFLGGIAAISLLVGGIGIMNIMLVSVTERTKEIGLRKALGAKKTDILLQFLTESSLLSLFGGIIGIIFGWLISVAVGKIATASGTPFNPAVGLNAILLATLFSTAVGLFFGIYPANRAANLEPVEALRYE
jgi:putative ABC transport system permease protein